jgi:hypothetical protein
MATNTNKIILTASRTCKTCHGKGWVQESHGEVLDCECAFENAPETTEAQNAIDEGRFTVAPAPEYIAEMESFNRIVDGYHAAERDRLAAEVNSDSWIDNALHSACEGDCGDHCE